MQSNLHLDLGAERLVLYYLCFSFKARMNASQLLLFKDLITLPDHDVLLRRVNQYPYTACVSFVMSRSTQATDAILDTMASESTPFSKGTFFISMFSRRLYCSNELLRHNFFLLLNGNPEKRLKCQWKTR